MEAEQIKFMVTQMEGAKDFVVAFASGISCANLTPFQLFQGIEMVGEWIKTYALFPIQQAIITEGRQNPLEEYLNDLLKIVVAICTYLESKDDPNGRFSWYEIGDHWNDGAKGEVLDALLYMANFMEDVVINKMAKLIEKV
jgi:hypothetical protein